MIDATNAAGRTNRVYGHELVPEGDNAIDTGDYLIRGKENELRIYDKKTQKWIKLWGDPHGVTSDGDKFQFHEDNLTFDLPDGTKVTVVPTEKNSNGKAYLDKVAIMKGDEAFVMRGLHDGEKGVKISHRKDAANVDHRFVDGTVLKVGDELDDLFTNGEEIVGTDASDPWGEWLVDGLGGRSDFEFWKQLVTEPYYDDDSKQIVYPEYQGISEAEFDRLGVYEKLALILQKLEERRDDSMKVMSDHADEPDGAAFTMAQLHFQKFEGRLKSLQTAMSNVVQAENQTLRTIAGNVRG